MTDNEIIKALEEELKTALTINHRFEESNDTESPDDHRFISLLSDTIKLINRLKAEIERLKDLIISNDEENLSYVAAAIKEKRELIQIEHTRILKAEIERLENKLFDAKQSIGFYKANFMAKCEEIDKVKAETIKEFAERLKESAFDCDVSFGYGREHYTKAVSVIEIDNLVKEVFHE